MLEPYPFDIGVLAGYMLIFAEEFAQRYDLLNLHPAAPGGPKGVWQDLIWQLIETRAERAGIMMHLATPELDEGPPVTYCTYSIRGGRFDELWNEVEGRSVADIKAEEGEANRSSPKSAVTASPAKSRSSSRRCARSPKAASASTPGAWWTRAARRSRRST